MTTWGEAFAEQAKADRKAYYLLSETPLPTSHRLHFLQMWLEKLCKAYVLENQVEAFRTTHNIVGKVLPRLIEQAWRKTESGRLPDMPSIRELCREIDQLHPQVHHNYRRPDNVEYPWLGISGEIEVPAHWKFPLASRLYSNAGRVLLKAADRLTENPTVFVPQR